MLRRRCPTPQSAPPPPPTPPHPTPHPTAHPTWSRSRSTYSAASEGGAVALWQQREARYSARAACR